MIEILAFVAVVGGIRTRAKQRRVDVPLTVGAAILGWVFFLVMGIQGLGFVGWLLRWAWLVGVYLFVELSHGGKQAQHSWQCPQCTVYNEPETLVCLCGYENPETI